MKVVRQAHDSRIPACKTATGRPPAGPVLREEGDLEQQLRLGFAARQLHRGHRLLSGRKSQAPARGFAADIEIRRAEAGRGPQGVLADAPLCQRKALGIVAQFRGKSLSPERDAARHGLLHVGVAGKFHDRRAARPMLAARRPPRAHHSSVPPPHRAGRAARRRAPDRFSSARHAAGRRLRRSVR